MKEKVATCLKKCSTENPLQNQEGRLVQRRRATNPLRDLVYPVQEVIRYKTTVPGVTPLKRVHS